MKDNSMEQTRTRRKGDKGVGSRQLGGRTRAWDDHAANVAGCNEAQITHATRPEPSGLQVVAKDGDESAIGLDWRWRRARLQGRGDCSRRIRARTEDAQGEALVVCI